MRRHLSSPGRVSRGSTIGSWGHPGLGAKWVSLSRSSGTLAITGGTQTFLPSSRSSRGRGNSRITRLRRALLRLKTNRLSHTQPAPSPLAYDPAPYRNRPVHGSLGGGTPGPRYSRVIPAVSGSRETQETGTYRLHAEVADHAQQHGEDRETFGIQSYPRLDFQDGCFLMDVYTPMARFAEAFDKEPFLANRRCDARCLVYTGRRTSAFTQPE